MKLPQVAREYSFNIPNEIVDTTKERSWIAGLKSMGK